MYKKLSNISVRKANPHELQEQKGANTSQNLCFKDDRSEQLNRSNIMIVASIYTAERLQRQLSWRAFQFMRQFCLYYTAVSISLVVHNLFKKIVNTIYFFSTQLPKPLYYQLHFRITCIISLPRADRTHRAVYCKLQYILACGISQL